MKKAYHLLYETLFYHLQVFLSMFYQKKKNYLIILGILLPTVLNRKHDFLSVSAIKKVVLVNFLRYRVLDEDVAIGARALELRRCNTKSVSIKR